MRTDGLSHSSFRSNAQTGYDLIQSPPPMNVVSAIAESGDATPPRCRRSLAAAEQLLPCNENRQIGGFKARNGIIRDGYEGMLNAPPKVRPRPFEIVLETPQIAPHFLQEKALLAGLLTILEEYRKLLAYAPDL